MSGHDHGRARSLWREALTHLSTTLPPRDEVARRAYVKYLAYGERSRDPMRDWLEAEAELTAWRRPAEWRAADEEQRTSRRQR
jgi:hypothetical protein